MKILIELYKTFYLEIVLVMTVPVGLLTVGLTRLITGISMLENPILHVVTLVLVGSLWIYIALRFSPKD